MAFFRFLLLALMICLTASCGDDAVGPLTGSIVVTTTTSGTDTDPNGYTIQIDANQPSTIGVSTTVEFSELTAGDHTVLLGDVASNCALVAGDNPVTVIVIADVKKPVTFSLTCSPAPASVKTGSTEAR